MVGQVRVNLLDETVVVRPVLVEPEDGLVPRGTSPLDRKTNPVLYRLIASCARSPNITLLNLERKWGGLGFYIVLSFGFVLV